MYEFYWENIYYGIMIYYLFVRSCLQLDSSARRVILWCSDPQLI